MSSASLEGELGEPTISKGSRGPSLSSQSSSSKKAKPCACCLYKGRLTGCLFALIVFSLVTLLVGIGMVAGGYDALFNFVLRSQMVVLPNSMSYSIWKDTPVPLKLSFYLYNITNPDEFTQGGTLNVTEIGPYVYQEFDEKTELSFRVNNTVAYYQKRYWVWDQAASGGNTQEDVVCFVNTVPVSAAYSVKDNDTMLSGLNVALTMKGEELILYRPVHEVLFDGYEDPLLDFVQSVVSSGGPIGSEIIDSLDPRLLTYDKMGWFYNRNMSETYDGHYSMFNGYDTLENLGNIDMWNEIRETDFFGSPCNQIFGSAGQLWPPQQDNTNISFFNSDLCMSITLPFKEPIVDSYGLDGYRYWADNQTFANPTQNPDNICYCLYSDLDNCPPSGLLDAQTCRMGAPAYISFPHFLHGDPVLLENVNGISPASEERHQFHIDMIPELGVPLKVNARMQLNMQLTPYPGKRHLTGENKLPSGNGKISILSTVPDMVVPILWFEESAELTEDLAKSLKPVMFLLHTPTMTIIWSLMIIFPTIFFSVFFTSVIKQRRKAKRLPLIPPDDETLKKRDHTCPSVSSSAKF